MTVRGYKPGIGKRNQFESAFKGSTMSIESSPLLHSLMDYTNVIGLMKRNFFN